MNIETREIRPLSELTKEELMSGKWIQLNAYVPKSPVSDRDFAMVAKAEAKRLRRAARRLDAMARKRP